MTVTKNIWQLRLDKAKARAEKRKTKRRALVKAGSLKSLIKRGPLKQEIVKLLGWLARKNGGNECQLKGHCPAYVRLGPHPGGVAYHLTCQGTGDGARFIPDNVLWCCSAANFGEKMNRAIYRMRHVELFGKERIERIEEAAKTGAKFSMADLLAMRDQIKFKLAQP